MLEMETEKKQPIKKQGIVLGLKEKASLERDKKNFGVKNNEN